MKPALLVLLAALLLCATMPSLSTSAAALQDGDYTYTVDGSSATITGYTGTGGAITIPSTLGGNTVVAIGAAFRFAAMHGHPLTSVVIPNTVTSIGDYAFQTSGLTSIDLGTGVTTIGYGAVSGCLMTTLTIPNSVVSIAPRGFAECPNLDSVTLGTGLISIGQEAFTFSLISSISIPSGVTSIGHSPFFKCSNLAAIDVSSSNPNYASIGGVLYNKDATEIIEYPNGKAGTSYSVPSGVTSIYPYAFCGSSLTSVGLPTSLTTIGESAFDSSSIAAITIPASVTEIGANAFYYCEALTAVNVDEGNEVYFSQDGVLLNATSLLTYPMAKAATSYTIPDGVLVIEDYTFYQAQNLVSVTIPNTVTTLEADAFESCAALESVIIGSGVTVIGSMAFYECTALTSITFQGLVAPTDVASDWLYGEYTSLLGHALAASDFPAPGQVWNGLTMGGAHVPSPPSVPLSLAVSNSTSQITVSWSAPESDGGSPITYYKVYQSIYGTETGEYMDLIAEGRIWQGDGTRRSVSVSYGMQTNHTYWFKVSAVNANGEGPSSAAISGTTLPNPIEHTRPNMPLNFQVSPGDGLVDLTWSPNSADGNSPVTGYTVYRSDSENGTYVLIASPTICQYQDAGLTNGQTYYYEVHSVNAIGEGFQHAGPLSATPIAGPSVASVPQDPSATGYDGAILLTWSAPASNGGSAITGYKVYRSLSDLSFSYGLFTLIASPTSTSYNDTSAINSGTYYYVVSAVNAIGESLKTDRFHATATPGPSAPTSPQQLLAVAGDAQVSLSWSRSILNGSLDITAYRIYRSTSSGGTYTLIASPAGYSYLDAAVSNGVTYYYQASAVNALGESARSDYVSATPTPGATAPTVPLSLTATSGDTNVTLTWSAPVSNGGSAITGYNVYQATASAGTYTLVASPAGTSYTNTGLTNGQTYYYKVAAVNAIGEGVSTPYAAATPTLAATVTGAPTGLSATSGNAQIFLSWSAPASDGGSAVTEYKVYRSLTVGGSYNEIVSTISTSYTNTGLTNGQTYYYKVAAVNAIGEGSLSAAVSATPVATVPGVPQSLVATPGNTIVTLTWSAPASNGGSVINGYNVYRSATQAGAHSLIGSPTSTTYQDTGLTNGVTYWYKVLAFNAIGEGGLSAAVSALLPATVPGVPQSLAATPGNTIVTLTWSAPASNGGSAITGYNVYWATASAGTYTLVASPAGTFYTNTGLTNEQTYYYKVAAVNAIGEGVSTPYAAATPALAVTVPGAPTELTATPGNTIVNLTWSAPESDGGSQITFYQVYRSLTVGESYNEIVSTTNTSYTNTGLTNGQTYYYRVAAVNAIGEGELTAAVSTMPAATVPGLPQSLVAVPGNTIVTLNWSAPASNGGSAITNYKVYRSATQTGTYLLIGTPTSNTYQDTSRTNGVIYWYKISAYNAIGEGELTAAVSTMPVATVPGVPQSLVAVPGDTIVTLTWSVPESDGGSDITHYKVYRSATQTGTYSLIGSPTSSTYQDTGLTNGVTYWYKVLASNAIGEGELTAAVDATRDPSAPSVPLSLAVSNSTSQITVSWSAPESDGGSAITYYKVYQSIDGTEAGQYMDLIAEGRIWQGDGTRRSIGVSYGMQTNHTYWFKVSAVNAIGEGPLSAAISGTTLPNPIEHTRPNMPLNFQVSPGDGLVDLTWSPNSADGGSPVTGYTVYRSDSENGTYVLIGSPTICQFQDAGLTNGRTYYYEVHAVNAIGEGFQHSGPLAATPVGGPSVASAPQNPSATGYDGAILLTWSAPLSDGGSVITGYKVYRSLSDLSFSYGLFTLIASPTSTSYNDTSAINSGTYYYVVSAVNAIGESLKTDRFHATATPGPSVPTSPQQLLAVAGDAQVSLSWSQPILNGSLDITAYRIYRSTSSGGTYTLIASPAGYSYLDATVSNGVTYYYKASAVNALGESARSDYVSATPTPGATAPTVPQSFAAAPGNTNVTLTWSAPASNGGSVIIGYKVYRSPDPAGTYALVASPAGTSYTNTGLTNGQTYYYKVAAVNAIGEGVSTPYAAATPALAATVPGAPTELTATPGNTNVTLTWSAPASNGGSPVTYYQVYCSLTVGGSYNEIVSTISTSYTNTGLTNGQTYYYKVAAFNAVGVGSRSAAVPGTPAADPPGVPRSVTVTTLTSSMLNVSWSAPASNGGSAITYYKVYRSSISEAGPYVDMILEGLLTQGDGTRRSILDTMNLAANHTYWYKISAINSPGEGPLSAAVSGTTNPLPVVRPNPPLTLTATPGDGAVSLSWSESDSDGGSPVTGYTLYRSTTSTGSFSLIASPTVRYHNDAGLTNGQTYYYRVHAVNAMGEGFGYREANATPVAAPTAPLSPLASAGNTLINLTWSAPASNGGSVITGYKVYRATTQTGTYLLIWSPTSTTYQDTGLTNGVTYWYKISAYNAIGEGSLSAAVSATPAATVPGVPQSFAAAPGDTIVNLTWSAPVFNGGSVITGYNLYRSATQTGTYDQIGGTSLTNFQDNGLTNGVTYWYKVLASNAIGDSSQTSSISATPQAAASVPGVPQSFAAVPGNTIVTLTWSAPAFNGGSVITGYNVYRSATQSGTYSLIGSPTSTTYQDTGLTNGQTYYYKVAAVNAIGDSSQTSSISATPQAAASVPGVPQSFAAVPGNTIVTLTWSAPASNGGSVITGYNLYRSATQSGTYSLIGTPTSTTYQDTSRTNGVTYWYKISAYNAIGEGGLSAAVSATPAATVPGVPQSLVAVPGNTIVTLTWSNPASNGGSALYGYNLYRSATQTGTYYQLVGVGSSATTYQNTGLTNGVTYWYKISAYNAIGEGSLSAAVSATPSANPSPSDFTYTLGGSPTVATVTGYIGAGGSITIPSTLGGYPTAYIGSAAFQSKGTITSVTIPDSVRAIYANAFRYCWGLSSVTIGNGVTLIGDGAFQECSNMLSVTLGNSVTSIGNNAFRSTAISELVLPNSLTSIGEGAFRGCGLLVSIALPNNVQNIRDYTFSECDALTSFTIPSGVTRLGNSSFYGCSGLTIISIGSGVTSMGQDIFYGCQALQTITVVAGNPNYSSIDGALYNKTATELLKYPGGRTGTFTIPIGVLTIGAGSVCENLVIAAVVIPDSVTTIGGSAFERCAALASITMGNGVTVIGERAFGLCTALTSVVISDSVRVIGDSAFEACTALTSITVGRSVTTILDHAFCENDELSSITFLGLRCPLNVPPCWIYGASEGILGHAYVASNFPTPGVQWHGLTMGSPLGVTVIPDDPDIPDDLDSGEGGDWTQVSKKSSRTWLYIAAGIAILLILAVLIAGSGGNNGNAGRGKGRR